MGYFFFQHKADSADFITHLLQALLSCLEKGKIWTEFGLKSSPWFGKMALRNSAEITSLIPFVTLQQHNLNPDLTPSQLSLKHWVSPLGPVLQPWVTLPMVITVMHTYSTLPCSLSITSFHAEKYSVVQQTDVLIYPSMPKNSGSFTKPLLMPTSFFYLETEMKQQLINWLPTQHISKKINCNKYSITFRKFSRVVSLYPN